MYLNSSIIKGGMVERKIAEEIIRTYGEGWVNQDIEKILSIFIEEGVYHERIFDKPFVGHEEIRQYWQSKVVEEQSRIKFKLLNLYIDGDNIIAEWDATFFSNKEDRTIHIREVAIMEIEGDRIKSLREYWHSER